MGHDKDIIFPGGRRRVMKIGMNGDAQVCRYGPGGGGPYHHIHVLSGQRRNLVSDVVFEPEFNINGRGCLIGVLNLGLGQGGLAVATPQNRFFVSGQIPFYGKGATFLGDGGFIGMVHGQIGVVPIPHDAQAFKLLPLNVNVAFGVQTALFPDLDL